MSISGIPENVDSSACLQLEVRLTNQQQWYNYGKCAAANSDVTLQDVRSRYCYDVLCSEATSAEKVNNSFGLIIILAALAAITFISIILNIAVFLYRRRASGSTKQEKPRRVRKPKSEDKSRGKIEPVEYKVLDIPMQTIPSGDSGAVTSGAYATIPESFTAFPRDQLNLKRELGQGAFGRVLLAEAKGILRRGVTTQVAIKTLKDGAGPMERGDLLRELDVMRTLPNHAHVIKLLGFCIDEDPVYIIVEFLSKGNLKDLLMYSRGKAQEAYGNLHATSKSLTSRDLIKFASEVAEGMAFLASQQCIHRDLAARNVLVGEDMVCKVSDFGLARDVTDVRVYQRMSEGPLPLRWMALESILDDVYTTDSDVWSFGVILWEIVTLGARPYPKMSAKMMIAKLQAGYRMPRPDHCQDELYQMMLACWTEEPSNRLPFMKLSGSLEKLLETASDYITLSEYQETLYEVTVPSAPGEKI